MIKILSVLCGTIAALIIQSPPAQATDICTYLDYNPTPAGVEDLVSLGIIYNGFTADQAGAFIYNVVSAECPRHLLTLDAFVYKYTGRTL